jgi:hypothetical protein
MPILLVYVVFSTLLGIVSLGVGFVSCCIKLLSMFWNLKTTGASTSATDNSCLLASPKSTPASSDKNLPLLKRIWVGFRVVTSLPWISLLQQSCCGENNCSSSSCLCYLRCGHGCRDVEDPENDDVEQESPLSLLLVGRRRPVIARDHVAAEHDNHVFNDLHI